MDENLKGGGGGGRGRGNEGGVKRKGGRGEGEGGRIHRMCELRRYGVTVIQCCGVTMSGASGKVHHII
jgi:hypothetical protein